MEDIKTADELNRVLGLSIRATWSVVSSGIWNLSQEEFDKIPTLAMPQIEKDFIERYATVDSNVMNVKVYSFGGGLFKIIVK